ncbi:MAG: argininosuccinate lyase [Thalassobaculaceae bacterium]
MTDTSPANAMWGGRFAAGPAEAMERINPSIDFDRRLWREDILGSKAHAEMLVAQNIITAEDGAAIAQGLDDIWQEIDSGSFKFSRALEDIHLNIENRLREKIGDAAGRMHTARSRNDQIATDMKLWTRGAIDALDAELKDLQAALIEQADRHADTIMPGFTHLQPAQPVTFGHHMLAYVEMIGRDRSRFADARRRLNENPLGAAALAGTPFPIDREMTATKLGFDRPAANSLDAVSDRDFVMEVLAAAGICAVHLSRLAEELVIWTTPQFRFVKLSDAFTTGSSIMPQKKNPDGAELVKGKAGRILAAFTGTAIVLKGLPLAYGKDMQEDKEPCFDAIDNLGLCIACTTGMIRDMEANPDSMRKAVVAGFPTATDLADWLVREAGLPFRDAHHITGQAVRAAEERGCGLEDLPIDVLTAIHPAIDDRIYPVLSVEASLNARTCYGGTAPIRVREQVAAARERFLSE